MNSKRKRREQLHAEAGGLCFWCGEETIPAVGSADNRAMVATLDHLDQKGSARRGRWPAHVPRTVLSCYGCNKARGSMTAAQWYEERLRRLRAKRRPLPRPCVLLLI